MFTCKCFKAALCMLICSTDSVGPCFLTPTYSVISNVGGSTVLLKVLGILLLEPFAVSCKSFLGDCIIIPLVLFVVPFPVNVSSPNHYCPKQEL